jgi:hypothetical protein
MPVYAELTKIVAKLCGKFTSFHRSLRNSLIHHSLRFRDVGSDCPFYGSIRRVSISNAAKCNEMLRAFVFCFIVVIMGYFKRLSMFILIEEYFKTF